jgi:hypothetical protein
LEEIMPIGDRRNLSGANIQRLFGAASITMELIGETTPAINVEEASYDNDTTLEIRQLDYLIFSATGSIWAGVWLTGENGPQGWNNFDNDRKFPLPGSHPYCLLGRLDGRYFYVGRGLTTFYRGRGSRLSLRTNDDRPGNGSGAFQCTIQQFRRI